MPQWVAVVTDSNSGIHAAEAAKLGIYCVPMPVLIDAQTYFEGVDIGMDAFYENLLSGRQVTTAMPSPEEVTRVWEAALRAHDALVYIPMSSGLSSSCASAAALAADYDGRVQVVDNHRISVTQRLSVLDAMRLAQEGLDAAEIRRRLEAEAYNASIYIAVDTLEFLKKGGRVTAAGAAIATVLGIRPILTIQGERLDACDKARGMKHAQQRMIERVRGDIDARFAAFDRAQLRIGAAGTFLEEGQMRAWTEMVQEAFPGFEVVSDPLSLSIGCHTGPNAAGVAVIKLCDA